MFGSAILDVAIGLVFTFTLLSLICSAVNELIAAVLATRAVVLERAIRDMLFGAEVQPAWSRQPVPLDQAFFDHPMVRGLVAGRRGAVLRQPPGQPVIAMEGDLAGLPPGARFNGWIRSKRPAYIPAWLFAQTLLDILVPEGESRTVADVRGAIQKLDGGQSNAFKQMLLGLLADVEGDIGAARALLERWYDEAMERLSGWYKRQAMWRIFVIALVVVTAFGVDSLALADHLYRDGALRAAVSGAAESLAREGLPTGSGQVVFDKMTGQIDRLQLPIGWGEPLRPTDGRGWLLRVLGLLLTVIAVAQGAPFWFDLLGKLVNVRAAGAPPKT
jgi:hypothetical protein